MAFTDPEFTYRRTPSSGTPIRFCACLRVCGVPLSRKKSYYGIVEKAQQWKDLLSRLGCIDGAVIRPPTGKRLHLYFGTIDVAPRPERPVKFDEVSVEAHDIHFTGDTSYVLWEDLTSVSIR